MSLQGLHCKLRAMKIHANLQLEAETPRITSQVDTNHRSKPHLQLVQGKMFGNVWSVRVPPAPIADHGECDVLPAKRQVLSFVKSSCAHWGSVRTHELCTIYHDCMAGTEHETLETQTNKLTISLNKYVTN